MFTAGFVPNAQFLFNDQGRISPLLTSADIERAREEQILNGLSILNIGGVEAIPLYQLGARTYCVDPDFKNTTFIVCSA